MSNEEHLLLWSETSATFCLNWSNWRTILSNNTINVAYSSQTGCLLQTLLKPLDQDANRVSIEMFIMDLSRVSTDSLPGMSLVCMILIPCSQHTGGFLTWWSSLTSLWTSGETSDLNSTKKWNLKLLWTKTFKINSGEDRWWEWGKS